VVTPTSGFGFGYRFRNLSKLQWFRLSGYRWEVSGLYQRSGRVLVAIDLCDSFSCSIVIVGWEPIWI